MPRDIVIVPSFYRPEYLYLALEYLAAATGGRDKEVWVGQDRHTIDQPSRVCQLPLIKQVVDQFQNTFTAIHYFEQQPHPYYGNPKNFLELYKSAYQTDARYVYLVEDDVHVGKDFFRWHEVIQARGNYFCSVGWHCIRNADVVRSEDPTAYIETSRDFSSIGVCWRRENLAAIIKHTNTNYYRTSAVYLRNNFPGSPIPPGQWTEQAGLIMRTLLAAKDKEFVAWPVVSRVAHVGINGYHRPQGKIFIGDLKRRVDDLRNACSSTSLLTMSGRPELKDINTLPNVGPWEAKDLHVTQRFIWEGKL